MGVGEDIQGKDTVVEQPAMKTTIGDITANGKLLEGYSADLMRRIKALEEKVTVKAKKTDETVAEVEAQAEIVAEVEAQAEIHDRGPAETVAAAALEAELKILATGDENGDGDAALEDVILRDAAAVANAAAKAQEEHESAAA